MIIVRYVVAMLSAAVSLYSQSYSIILLSFATSTGLFFICVAMGGARTHKPHPDSIGWLGSIPMLCASISKNLATQVTHILLAVQLLTLNMENILLTVFFITLTCIIRNVTSDIL